MWRHLDLGAIRFGRSRRLKTLIDGNELTLGGNSKLKIYGSLQCKSGKRMKVESRVFFANEAEARALGYRPCANCMHAAYIKRKDGIVR